jgi:hypothetical protein
MPHTVRVRATLGRHLLASGDRELRRRVEILRDVPFLPGSRSITADADMPDVTAILASRKRAFVYGSRESALVYTYDSATGVLAIEFGVSYGQVVGLETQG